MGFMWIKERGRRFLGKFLLYLLLFGSGYLEAQVNPQVPNRLWMPSGDSTL